MANAYSAGVLEHFHHPRHAGMLSSPGTRASSSPGTRASAAGICTGCAGGVKSGVQVCFQLQAGADGVIADVAWRAYGCPSTLAAASWLAEHVKGRTVAAAALVSARDISAALAVAPQRRTRIMLVEDALKAALQEADQAEWVDR